MKEGWSLVILSHLDLGKKTPKTEAMSFWASTSKWKGITPLWPSYLSIKTEFINYAYPCNIGTECLGISTRKVYY